MYNVWNHVLCLPSAVNLIHFHKLCVEILWMQKDDALAEIWRLLQLGLVKIKIILIVNFWKLTIN